MSSPKFFHIPAPEAYYSLSPVAKLTWIGLCSYAHWDGILHFSHCYPSQEGISARSGLSVASVKRGLHELVEKGFIIRRRRVAGRLRLTSECFPGPALMGGFSEALREPPPARCEREPVGPEGALSEPLDSSEGTHPGSVRARVGLSVSRRGALSEPQTQSINTINKHDQGEEEEAAAAALSRIIELWNRTLTPLGFPRVAVCTAGRRKALKARMRESAERRDMAWWEALMSRIAGTPFLVRGVKEGARWFTLDWLLREENLVKLLEGRYEGENRLHGPRAGSEDVHSLDVEGFVRKMMRDPFWGGEEDDGEGTPTPPGLS